MTNNWSNNTSNITVLVHGKVEKDTKLVLANVRSIFKDSKIILSTWKNSDLKDLDYDILVENNDPGAKIFNVPEGIKPNKKGLYKFTIGKEKFQNVKGKYNNVNRMLVTAKNGLEKVETEYVLRIRTDIILENSNFLKYWDLFPKHNGKYKIFKHRIINDSTFAQFAHVMKNGIHLLPFHMSDWIHFGLTEDVKLLYSCPLQDIEDSAQYWYNPKNKRKQFDPFIGAGWRYPAEQHILYELVKKKFPEVKYENSDDYNEENMQVSNMIIADNFIMIDQPDFKFDINKYPSLYDWPAELYNGFITYREWQNLYKTYCDSNYKYLDIDLRRITYYKKLYNIVFFLKYPGKYFRLFKDFLLLFNKEKLRKNFYITTLTGDSY